jgi:hypothetical protein
LVEVSVDTNVARRRNTAGYRVFRQDGIELLVSPGLARQSRRLSIDLKRFWFFRNLKAVAESPSGLAQGRPRA